MNLNSWASILSAAALLVLNGCLGGCSKAGPSNWPETRQQIRDIAEIASATGCSGYASVRFGGRPSIGMANDFYLGSDVEASAFLQFNAKGGVPLSAVPIIPGVMVERGGIIPPPETELKPRPTPTP